MNKIWVILFFFCMIGVSEIRSESTYFIPSSVGSSAKSVRLGNVNGFSNASDSVFDNPAALFRVNKFSSSLFATTFMEEVVYQNASIGVRLPVGVLAVGYMGVGVADVPKTRKDVLNPSLPSDDPTNYEIASESGFSYSNQMLKVAYEFSQNKYLHFGISGSYFTTVMDTYKATGLNADVGVVIESGPLAISIAAKNVIPSLKVKYTNSASATYNQTESLPMETSYGAKYKMDEITLLGQITMKDSDKKMLKAAGIEYTPKFVKMLRLSAGYKEFSVITTTKSSISMGLGLELAGVNFDYAYEQSDHIIFNSKHYFSVGLSF